MRQITFLFMVLLCTVYGRNIRQYDEEFQYNDESKQMVNLLLSILFRFVFRTVFDFTNKKGFIVLLYMLLLFVTCNKKHLIHFCHHPRWQ